MIYVAAIILLILLISVFVYTQSVGFVSERYEFSTDKISGDFHFVFLSDLHETQHDKNNNKIIIEELEKISPQYVLIGGDFITSYKDITDDFYKTLDFIKEISKRFKVIFVPGNHEHALLDLKECDENPKPQEKDDSDIFRVNKLLEVLEELEIPVLRNEGIVIGDIVVYGLDLPLKYYRRLIRKAPEVSYLKDLLGEIDGSKYNIMLAHDPEHFGEYSEIGVDLTLSGHLHGGIVRVPGIGGVISPQLKIFPKYDSGVFEKDNCRILISRGIGTHSIPVRIFNRAEICDVYIHGV